MSKKPNPVETILDRMVEVVLGDNAVFKSHSEVLGIPAGTIRTWRNRGEVPTGTLAQFATDWKVSMDWLLHGGAATATGEYKVDRVPLPDDFVLVPRYDVRAGAGGGQAIHDDAVVDHLAFKRDWIVGSLDLEPRRVALIEVHGDSMQPTLGDGDLILVDLRNGHMRQPGVYVIQHSGHLLVKRLAPRMDGGVDVISDNPAYAAERLGREAADVLVVIGRVVWSGGKI